MALENIHHETQEYKDGATVDTSPYRWRCVHCDISTVSQSLLADHWLRAHQRHLLAEYVRARGHCPVCGQRITNQLRIVAHVQSDRGDFRCEKCHMVFANSGAVIKHKCSSRELLGSEDSCSNPRFAKSQTSIIRSDRQHFDVRHIDKTQVHSHGRNSRSTWLPNSIKPCRPQSSCIREDPQCSSKSISTGIIDSNDSHDYYLRSIDSHSVIRVSNASCNNNVLSIDSHSIINRSNGSDNGLNDPTQVRIKSDDSPNAEFQSDSVTLDEGHDNDSRSVNSTCIADTRCDSFSYAAGNFVPNTDSSIARRLITSTDNSTDLYKKSITDISHETVTGVSHQSTTDINQEPLAGIARESVCDLSHRRHSEDCELQTVSEMSNDANKVHSTEGNSVNKNNINTANIDDIDSDLETVTDSSYDSPACNDIEDNFKLNTNRQDIANERISGNPTVRLVGIANVPLIGDSQTTSPDNVSKSIDSGQSGESGVDVLQSAVESVLNDCQSTGDKQRPVGSCDLLASSCMDCGIISADVGEDGEVEVCGSQHTGPLVSRASTCINPPSVGAPSDTGSVGGFSSAVGSTISDQSDSIAAVSPRNSSYGSLTSSSCSQQRDAGLSSNLKTTSAELSADSIVQTSNMLTVLTKADSVYHISNPVMLNALTCPRYILVSSVVTDTVSSANTAAVLNSSAANSVPVMDWNLSNIVALSSRKTHVTSSSGSDIICSNDNSDDSIQSTIKPSSIPDNIQLVSCAPRPTEAPSTEAFIVTSNCTRTECLEISPNSSAVAVACSLSYSTCSKLKDIVVSTAQASASNVKACSSLLNSPLIHSLSNPSITLSSTLSVDHPSPLIPITSSNLRSSPSSPANSNSSSVQISTTPSSISNPDITTPPSTPANSKPRACEKFVCDVCGHLFANSSSLRNHQLLHVQPGFACRLCGRKFARKDTLLNHFSSHSTAQVRCPLCPRRLKTRKSLAIHMKLHSGQSHFPCPHCSRSFIQKNSLQRHLAGVHSNQTGGDGPFVCPVCRRHFVAQYRLKRHMVLHNRERVFVCVVCSRSFCSGEDLRRHTRAVHSAAQYVCPYCRVRIRVKSNMIRHLTRTHQNCRSEWQCVGFVDNLLQIASDSSTTAALLAPHTVLMTLTSGGHSGNLDSDQQQSDTKAEQESDVVLYVLSAPSDS